MPPDEAAQDSPPRYELTEKANGSSPSTATENTNRSTSPATSSQADQQRCVVDESQPLREKAFNHGDSVQRPMSSTPDAPNPYRSYGKPRRSLRYREPRSCGMVWRILLSASLLATVVYAAMVPLAMAKNTALCVTVGVGAFVAAAQLYIIVVRFLRCVPYSVWVVVALDAVSVLGWLVAVAVLSYWHIEVLYAPRAGDPAAWTKQCYDARNGYAVYDGATGGGTVVNMVWCKVDVDGRRRLIGNGAARLQHRVVIGLSAVSLLFNSIVLFVSVCKQRSPDWGNV